MTTQSEQIKNFKLKGKAVLAVQPRDLIAAGWTPRDLIAAGWTPRDLIAAGWTPRDLIAAGWTPRDLIDAGWTPRDLIDAGWTLRALIAAGWTLRDLIDAGWTPRDLIAAGWTPRALEEIEDLIKHIPVLEKPYSLLLTEIENSKRLHDQRTFGPDQDPGKNICGTPMCTAGHLVNMAGEVGYKLKDKTGWHFAASVIHEKAHPDLPAQNFNAIPQEIAMEYIRQMAKIEEGGCTDSATE